nr:Chain C, ARG-GLU-PHE-SER-LYS-GLU-PRO-GLU-LEU [Homo sapiens]
REFSKEPEL